jgi:glycosyltransferase involved in cell wall biosynthesis
MSETASGYSSEVGNTTLQNVNKKRVALIISHPVQHFCPQYSSLAKHPKIDFKVFFASSTGYDKYFDPNFKKEISWSGMTLDFPHEFVNGREAIPITNKLDAPKVGDALKRYSPDIIIIYGYIQKYTRRVHSWARKNGIKIAYISDSEMRHRRKGWYQIPKKFFVRWYFSKIAFFLSVGNANEEYYKYHGVADRQIIRMHFPIDIEKYNDAYQIRDQLRSTIRAKHQIGNDRVVTAVVGKLVPWKNQDHLIDALLILEKRGVQLDLIVIGSGETEPIIREKMTQLKSNRVYLAGFINTDELRSYYAASDFYTHPSMIEPHSIAISEAIAMGLPIICSSTCGSHGPQDDVQIGVNGDVYPFGNIEELANRLQAMCQSQETRAKMGNISRKNSVMFQNRSHGFVIDELIERLGS